jgi:hypothetical protein
VRRGRAYRGVQLEAQGRVRQRETRWLRAVGTVCLFGVASSALTIAVALSIGGRDRLVFAAGFVLGVCLVVPYVVMQVYLWFDHSLTKDDRRRWRRQSDWGVLSFIVPFFYLLRKERRFARRKAR